MDWDAVWFICIALNVRTCMWASCTDWTLCRYLKTAQRRFVFFFFWLTVCFLSKFFVVCFLLFASSWWTIFFLDLCLGWFTKQNMHTSAGKHDLRKALFYFGSVSFCKFSWKPQTAALLPPVLLCIPIARCGRSCWVVRRTESEEGSQTAGVRFRGKFADVLTRVEGSERGIVKEPVWESFQLIGSILR